MGLAGRPAVPAGWYNRFTMSTRPIVLCIGGHDPTGGAGIQADIETVVALGGRATTLVTALTAQDTHNVCAVWAATRHAFSTQFDTLIADIGANAIKLGLIGDVSLVEALTPRLAAFDGPIVLDPVMAAGGGFDLGCENLSASIRERLLPLTTLVTPNRAEARRLTGLGCDDDALRALLDDGAAAILLTGADEASGNEVVNRLSTADGIDRTFAWPHLAGSYHGSGCTLASACATLLALGQPLVDAVAGAQAFTHDTLSRSVRVGHAQQHPGRLP